MLYDKKNKFSNLTLKESEYEIIDGLDIGFFRVSLDGTFLAHNQKYNEIFGIDPLKSLNGEKTFNFWQNQHDREKFLIELKANGKVKNYIVSAKKINGEVIVLQCNSHLIYDDNDLPIATEGTIIDITEKYNLQKELEESEKRYRDIAELLPDVIFETDTNLNLTYVNSIAFNKFGYSKEEFNLNLNIHQFIDITSRKLASKNLKLLFEGKETKPQQYLLVKKDGSKFYGLVHSRPRYKDNKIIGIRGSITDINNLVLAEQELKESEEKFRRIFESIPDLFFLVSEDSTILDYTGKEDDLYIPLEKFIGKRLSEVLPSNVGSLINDHIKKTLETQNPHYLEYSLPIKNEIRHFEARFLYFSKNNIAIFIRNISKRKKTEAKLKESEEKFRTIAEQSLLGIAILQDNTFKYVNEKFAGVGGRNIDDVMGWKLPDFINTIHPEDKKIIIEYAKKRQQGIETERSGYECRCFKKNGDLMWVQTYSKSILFEGALADQITILDITNSKLAEQKLIESEKKYRHLYESSPYGILLVNMEGKIIDCNKAAEELSGFKRTELVGKSFADKSFISKEYIYSVIKDYESLIKTGILEPREIQLFTRDKVKVWVSFQASTFQIENEKVIQVLIEKIEERKKAEETIKQSEARYHSLFENTPIALTIQDYSEIKNHIYHLQSLGVTNFEKFFDENPDQVLNLISKAKMVDLNKKTLEIYNAKNKEEYFRRIEKMGHNVSEEQLEDVVRYNKMELLSLIQGESVFESEVKSKKFTGEPIHLYAKTSIVPEYEDKWSNVIISLLDITDKKFTEEKLKLSEEKYHQLYNTSPDGVILTDLNGNIIECNSALESITGYFSQELIGKNFIDLDLYLENALEQLRIGYKDLLGDSRIDSVEFPIETKEGDFKWIQINSNLLTMQNETYILSVIHDITRLKEAEKALKESEKKFKDILETSSVGVMELDVFKKKLLYINPKLIEIVGYKKEDINEEIFRQKIIHRNDLAKLAKTNEEAELEFRITDRQGRLKWLAGKRIPHYNNHGEIDSIRVWLDDITEKKMYENLIYELNINFLNFSTDIRKNIDLLLNTCLKLLDGDLLLYFHKTITSDKENYQIITSENKMYNFNSEQFHNLFISIFFQEEHDFPQTFLDINRMKYAESDQFIREHKFKGSFGKVIKSHKGLNSAVCILYKDNPIVSGQDKLVLFLICDALEIEQRRWKVQNDLEKQNITLNKINKLKSELFSRTSHELKTPLISVKGFTELLLTLYKSKLDPEVISILEEIRDGGKRLEKIINLLLDSTKLEAGQLSLNVKDEDLTFLIKFCVKELKGLAKLRNQNITLNLQDNLKTKFDKERIYEVISNLLVNAIKYTPPGGNIVIESKKTDGSYEISVKDNGIGFTDEEKSHVFKQFGKIERYGQGWDIAADGTGLGLYITKKLVELHGGKIWLESEGRNKGTTFYFSIPILK
ncbi:MAG: PAS domain S-box protein [Candidatus Hermodarchaeota archaeon]